MSQPFSSMVSDYFPYLILVAIFAVYYFGVVRKQVVKYDDAVAAQKVAIAVLHKILAALVEIKAGLKGKQS
jgi:hypothetical protein